MPNFVKAEGVVLLVHQHTGKSDKRQTFTCCHCNTITELASAAERKDTAWCSKCMAPKCDRCAGKPCTPFMRKIEKYEARWRLYRDIGIADRQ